MYHLKKFLFSLFILLSTTSGAQISGQVKDFEIFRKGLFSVESKLDRHISLDSINSFLAFMKTSLSEKELSPVEQYKLYARCINLIQSGHTQVIPTKPVLKYYVRQAKALPFDMVIVNKHLYLKAYPKNSDLPEPLKREDKIPVGSEITAIDGKSLSDWMKLIGEFIGSDENEPVFEYTIAAQAFDFFRFIATTEQKSQLKIDYIVKNDTLSKTVQLGFPPVKVLFERLKKLSEQQEEDRESIGTFKQIGSDAGYFRFTSFANCTGKDYSEFLQKSFKKIRSKKLQTVVIDVRGNGGGIIQTELLSYFMAEPQVAGNYQIVRRPKWKERRHLEKLSQEFRRHRKNVRIYKKIERRNPDFKGDVMTYRIDNNLLFKGKVIVLTDEGSFSASSLLASQLKELRGAQIMGSRAGGTYYAFNAGTLKLELPHSKIQVILNPNTGVSTLSGKPIDPNVKNVDVEIVPEYSPKASVYKKNWESVINIAIAKSKEI